MKKILCVLFVLLLMLTGCAKEPEKPAEPVSGKYCVIGVDGETTYPEYTALKFDFESMEFNFGQPNTPSSWIRKGALSVDNGRITAVCYKQKYRLEGDDLIPDGYYTWVFEIIGEGRLRFLPEDSDEFETYGTFLDAGSILTRIGDL